MWLPLPAGSSRFHKAQHVYRIPLKIGLRPLIELEATDHPLSMEQRNGITVDRVRQIQDDGAYNYSVAYAHSTGTSIEVNNNAVLTNLAWVASGNNGQGNLVTANILTDTENRYGLKSGSLTPVTFLANDSQAEQGSAQQSADASAFNTNLVMTNCFPGGH